MIDAIDLAEKLIRIDTTNPAGNEAHAATLLGTLLADHGFAVSHHEWTPGRTGIIARSPGQATAAPLAFTGHLDTVPFGQRPWTMPPLGAERHDGRMYGRGASDMKAGVAAVVSAVVQARDEGVAPNGLMLILTAAEEIGCVGARRMALAGALGRASGLVIAEPTSNRLVVAHKGALHLRLRTVGRTAHGSMPELGDNAVLRAVRAIQALTTFSLGDVSHPLLGPPTLAVTTISGGENINSIPDSCSVMLDIRTIPGLDHGHLLSRLQQVVGEDVVFDPPLVNLPAVGSDPDSPFVRCVGGVAARHVGADAAIPRGMPYFTDGSVLQPAYNDCPTVIIGPGEPRQAHQTDESCPIDAIQTAVNIYVDIARCWTADVDR